MKKKFIFNEFSLFVAIACILTLALNVINGRFHLGDFMVYYSAAGNLISGKQVYLVSFYTESGFYKYSPAFLFFFIPYTFFGFKTAAVIHFLLLGAAYWYTFTVIRKLITESLRISGIRHEVMLLSISFGCILLHFTREMYLGNINIILLLLCCLAILNLINSRDKMGGVLLGIVFLAKPYLLFLLLPLVLRKKWKALKWSGVTVAGGLALPFIYPGPEKSLSIYGDWIKSILTHHEGFPGMTSLDYLIRQFIISWPSWGIFLVFILVASVIAVFILNNLQWEKRNAASTGLAGMNFTFEWLFMIALVPNLIRTDWVLLLFSAPLITFMIFYISGRGNYGWIPVMVILVFFYGANSDDLLGRELSRKILYAGLMGLGNFLLVMVSLIMFTIHRKKICTP